MSTKLTKAPNSKFRVLGSDAHSIWIERDFKLFPSAKNHVDKKVLESNGYDSMSIYNDRCERIYTAGLSGSAERSMRPLY